MLVANPLSPRSWGREVVDSVSKGWWALLLSGLISIVAGGLILLIRWSVGDLAIFLGALFLFRGVVTMFSRPLDGSSAGWAPSRGTRRPPFRRVSWLTTWGIRGYYPGSS